jgi:hypothetical protein
MRMASYDRSMRNERGRATSREATRREVLHAYSKAARSAERAPQAFEDALAEYRKRHHSVAERDARHAVAEMLSSADDDEPVG